VGADPDAVGIVLGPDMVLILAAEAVRLQCVAATLVGPAVAVLVVLHRRRVCLVYVVLLTPPRKWRSYAQLPPSDRRTG